MTSQSEAKPAVVLMTPKKPPSSLKSFNSPSSPLDELASLACSFSSSTSASSPESQMEVINQSNNAMLQLQTKLDFNMTDLKLASDLSLLRNSGSSTTPKKQQRKLFDNNDQVISKAKKQRQTKIQRTPKSKTSLSAPSSRKKRKNEWDDDEIVILLQVTKLMIDCELKSVAKALFEIIERSPGKSYGRAAEKKLKRMSIFENWKKCSKDKIIQNINAKLVDLKGGEVTERTKRIAEKYRELEKLAMTASVSSSTSPKSKINQILSVRREDDVRVCLSSMVDTVVSHFNLF